MATFQQSAGSPIQRLPLELQWCILRSLDNVTSLMHAALSCRSLYDAFKKSENSIITTLLVRYIGADVLPEAIVVQQCRPPVIRSSPSSALHFQKQHLEMAQEYVFQFLSNMRRPNLDTHVWNIRSALQVERLHYHVRGLTNRFVHACANANQVQLRESFQNEPPTSAERARIARSFYRFELFRLLCGGPDPYNEVDDDFGRGLWAFFPFFSPVECAQLACVHDFLCHQTVPFLSEFSHRHPQGRMFYGGESLFLSPDVQGLLALGLERLHNTFSARSYSAQVRAMELSESHSFAFYKFLDHALECYWAEELDDFYWRWGDVRASGVDFCVDTDPGPRQMWMLSQRRNDVENLVNMYHQNDRPYRQWGFVMWNSRRLQQLGVLG